MRVVIADDDELSRRRLDLTLRAEGYSLEFASDGAGACELLAAAGAPPAVAVLDVVMPRMGGVEVCRRVRRGDEAGQPYIILLTARASKRDIVAGLEAGANDYVAKPFDAAELRARVRVGAQMLGLQRRLRERVAELEQALARARHLQGLLRGDPHTYEFGPFRLEAAERRLHRGGVAVPLTARVFDLLLLLVQNGGHLVGKDEIMREVWSDSTVEDNNLTVSISVLRKALGGDAEGGYIETVPKLGYRFARPVTRFG